MSRGPACQPEGCDVGSAFANRHSSYGIGCSNSCFNQTPQTTMASEAVQVVEIDSASCSLTCSPFPFLAFNPQRTKRWQATRCGAAAGSRPSRRVLTTAVTHERKHARAAGEDETRLESTSDVK
eukprot:6180642-Pleurochrysis_carterae.AAC.2